MVEFVQRWRGGSEAWRDAAESIRTREYEVAAVKEDAVAKAFVVAHHYSGSYPAARFRYGLYTGGELVGVAVFSHPVNDRVLRDFPGSPLESVELGRFVLLDGVPGNGETWFLARCFGQLKREGLVGVASFSDPVPRTTLGGEQVHPGHVGVIYQAHNAVYRGRGKARTLRLLPDGSVLSERALQKLRKRERGWEYVARQLVAAGAEPPGKDLGSWARAWLPRVTRGLRHPGNHKYLWGLNRSVSRALPQTLPYPEPPGGRAAPKWGRRVPA